MLILARKPGQKIVINRNIIIKIHSVDSYGVVRIGIEAPKDVVVDREEVHKLREKVVEVKL